MNLQTTESWLYGQLKKTANLKGHKIQLCKLFFKTFLLQLQMKDEANAHRSFTGV